MGTSKCYELGYEICFQTKNVKQYDFRTSRVSYHCHTFVHPYFEVEIILCLCVQKPQKTDFDPSHLVTVLYYLIFSYFLYDIVV
jgi:hypothetical protein